jgi:hypothetical protein
MKKTDMPDFIPTQWSTSADKKRFAQAFIRLVEGDFKLTLFPKWFYQRLSNCFSNIAHYNQGGFYDAQFCDAAHQSRFISNCLNHPCYGDPRFTYSDVERFLQTWIQDNGILDRYLKKFNNEVYTSDMRDLQSLASKYNYQLVK